MRTSSLLSALTVFAAVGVAPVAPATASTAGSCSLRVPARIAINSPYQAVKVSLGPNCAAAGVVDAYWTAYHPVAGGAAFAAFETKARTGVVDVYDFDPLGRWSWRPSGAFGDGSEPIAQNSLTSMVKVASWSGLKASRAGAKVTLTVSAARYAASLDRLVGWAAATGQLQYKVPGTTTWKPLKSVRTTNTGHYTYTYTMPTPRDYRAVFPTTSLIWNTTTPTTRK
ncbi:hypothetical protein [Kribbella deserti]|uniref:Uncharacterized protein n=1 Tax=Kribbella deserti TaxID=1926257 RepID=A0ABV6QL95_9ACTN